MNYDYLFKYKIYKQTLFQTILKGIDLKVKKVYFGLTADFEKRKVGAVTVPKVAYIQTRDNYNSSIVGLFGNKLNDKRSA